MNPLVRPLLAAAALALATAPGVPAADGEARTLRLADGAEMAYVVRGAGLPALVFVHCGNCRMSIWDETLAAFERDFVVVAMDLPGYGRSPAAPRRELTIPGYGADVAALVEHLGLSEVVLVGNSLGGPVALEAARRLGADRVLGVVAVDTLQDLGQAIPEAWVREQAAAYRTGFVAECDRLMLGLVPADAAAAVRARVERETCDNEPAAAIALLESLPGYDMAAAAKAAAVPIVAINSTMIPTAVEANRAHAVAYDALLMTGVGHYPQVERPAEFQARLREALALLARRPAPAGVDGR